MMTHKSKTFPRRMAVMVAVSCLAIAALACSGLPFGLGGSSDSSGRIATLEAQLQAARSTATAEGPQPGAGGGDHLLRQRLHGPP